MPARSPNRKGSIRGSLLVAEKNLRKIKTELEGHAKGKGHTIMYQITGNVEVKTRSKMIKIINTMLKEIEGMKDDFGLEIPEDESEKHIFSSLGETWVVLEEITPNYLKNYGQVSEAEKALIEPRVSTLLRQFDELGAAFKE